MCFHFTFHLGEPLLRTPGELSSSVLCAFPTLCCNQAATKVMIQGISMLNMVTNYFMKPNSEWDMCH